MPPFKFINMIPAVILPALTGLAEEYLIARRALLIYNTLDKVSSIASLLSSTASKDRGNVDPVVNDEIYFYLVTIGLYKFAYRQTSNFDIDWDKVFSMVDEAIASDIYYNAPSDAKNRIAAFATSLGRTLAIHDPAFITPLADVITYQKEFNTLQWFTNEAANNRTTISQLASYLQLFEISPAQVDFVASIYSGQSKEAGINTYIESFRAGIEAKSLDLSTSFPNIVYSMMILGAGNQNVVDFSNNRKGSPIFFSTALAYAPAGYSPNHRPRKMYQGTTLTTSMVNATEKRIMVSNGFVYNNEDKEWVKSSQAHVEFINSQRRQEDDTIIPREVISNVITEVLTDRIKRFITSKINRKR